MNRWVPTLLFIALVSVSTDTDGGDASWLAPSDSGVSYSISYSFIDGRKKDFVSVFVDRANEESAIMSFDVNQRLRSCVVDDNFIDFEADEVVRRPIVFSFPVREGMATMHYQDRDHTSKKSNYALPLPAILKSVTVQRRGVVPVVMKRVVEHSDGTIALWYRMPVEAEILGYPLSLALSISDSGHAEWFTNIVSNEQNLGRLNHTALNTTFKKPIDSKTTTDCLRAFEDDHHEAWAEPMRRQYDLAYALHLKELDQELTELEIAKRELFIFKLMQEARECLDSLLCDDTTIFLDPHIRGLLFEQLLWRPGQIKATRMRQVAEIIGSLQLRASSISMSHSLWCNYADLGFAPNATSHVILNKMVSGAEVKEGAALNERDAAAILARWRWPVKDHHVDAIVEFSESAKHATDRMRCVETLVLAGQINRTPPETLGKWFQQSVLDSDSPERKLSLLMQTPSGREFLMKKHDQLDEGDIRETIRNLFHNEVEALRVSKDRCFFTEQEFDAIVDHFDFASVRTP